MNKQVFYWLGNAIYLSAESMCRLGHKQGSRSLITFAWDDDCERFTDSEAPDFYDVLEEYTERFKRGMPIEVPKTETYESIYFVSFGYQYKTHLFTSFEPDVCKFTRYEYAEKFNWNGEAFIREQWWRLDDEQDAWRFKQEIKRFELDGPEWKEAVKEL